MQVLIAYAEEVFVVTQGLDNPENGAIRTREGGFKPF